MCPLFTIVGHVKGDATLQRKYLEHFSAFPGSKSRNSPVSAIRRECDPLCLAESSSGNSSKLFLWEAEKQ